MSARHQFAVLAALWACIWLVLCGCAARNSVNSFAHQPVIENPDAAAADFSQADVALEGAIVAVALPVRNARAVAGVMIEGLPADSWKISDDGLRLLVRSRLKGLEREAGEFSFSVQDKAGATQGTILHIPGGGRFAHQAQNVKTR